MDKRKLNKVVRDVKKILILAKSAHDHLEKNQIRKAQRELKRVMSYDADEITRLHDEDEGMSHQLLHECGVILKDAKKALYDLNSSELFDEAKQLIDEIVTIEGHELIELREEEKKENELYEYWHSVFRKFQFTHTTSSIIAEDIATNGVKQGRKPEIFRTVDEISNVIKLLARSGFHLPIHISFTVALPGFYVSAKESYAPFALPEGLKYFIEAIEDYLKYSEFFVRSGGSYDNYVNLMTRAGYHSNQIMQREFFERINFSQLGQSISQIELLFSKLIDFKKRSRSVILLIDAIGILDDLPRILRLSFNEFSSFKRFIVEEYFNGSLPSMTELRRIINTIIENSGSKYQELIIRNDIDARYIHIR